MTTTTQISMEEIKECIQNALPEVGRIELSELKVTRIWQGGCAAGFPI